MTRATTENLLADMIILASTLFAKRGACQDGFWKRPVQKRFSLLPGVEEEGERKEEKDPSPQLST
jgi:hypothetical protein